MSTREGDGHVVVMLHGEFDVANAADVAAALGAVAARVPDVIVDLAGLEFMDASGVAALAHGRRQARRAGGDVLLAAARPRVLRIITSIRLADGFRVYAGVEEAVSSVGYYRPMAMPVPRRSGRTYRLRTGIWSRTRPVGRWAR
ncbi:MAG: STAS domain-containing protein [Streptosporangiaceae bacterium]